MIGVIGASGKFGSAILKAAIEDGRFDVESISARQMPEIVISNTWIYAGLGSGLLDCLRRAVEQNIRLVVGTTGLSEGEIQSLYDAAEKISVFYSPNFSLGVALMKKLAVETAKKFHSDAYIDLVETHHAAKKDAPSGTALWIAREVEMHHEKKCVIHSLRTGKVVGKHTLLFNTAEESLTISHESHSSSVYGRGALAAALFLENRGAGAYSMDDLLA